MTELEKTQTAADNTTHAHQNFSIKGMTCESCVKTITAKLLSLPDVLSAEVSLEAKKAHVQSLRSISLEEVRNVLKDNPKYTVEEFKQSSPALKKETDRTESVLKTYKPLITVFTFIILVSISHQVSLGHFHVEMFMMHIMAGFFIGLSFFKFLDLNAFSESFSSYDPIAQRWLGYGKLYPFIELMLGLLFIAGKMLLFANVVTILVLSVTTYGVYLRLKTKSKFQCACLGTSFNLPLSNVTLGENIVMILMAVYGVGVI